MKRKRGQPAENVPSKDNTAKKKSAVSARKRVQQQLGVHQTETSENPMPQIPQPGSSGEQERGRTSNRKSRHPKKHRSKAPVRQTLPNIQKGDIPLTSSSESDAESEIAEGVRTDSEMDNVSVSSKSADSLSHAEAHLSMITGNDGYSTSFIHPISSHISQQIPSKIKKQIWSNKFIDFAALLPNTTIPTSTTQFTLQLDSQSNINITPINKTKKIHSIEQWTTAFMRFVAIYSERFPLETPSLMKYGEIVRDLAQRRQGNSWQIYDTQFRMLRSTSLFPWHTMHYEFWLMACSGNNNSSSSNNQRSFRPNNQSFPGQGHQHSGQRKRHTPKRQRFWPNTCWIYNQRGECRNDPCPHPHVCGYCKGNHTAGRCSFQYKEQAAQSLLGQPNNSTNPSRQPHKPATTSQR